MLDVILDLALSLKNWQKWSGETHDPDRFIFCRNKCEMIVKKIRNTLRNVHGEDYTAALDILAEEFGTFYDFI